MVPICRNFDNRKAGAFPPIASKTVGAPCAPVNYGEVPKYLAQFVQAGSNIGRIVKVPTPAT